MTRDLNIYWRFTVQLTLMMTSAQVVETSVNVTSNSPSQDYTHPDDHNLPNYNIRITRNINSKQSDSYLEDVSICCHYWNINYCDNKLFSWHAKLFGQHQKAINFSTLNVFQSLKRFRIITDYSLHWLEKQSNSVYVSRFQAVKTSGAT